MMVLLSTVGDSAALRPSDGLNLKDLLGNEPNNVQSFAHLWKQEFTLLELMELKAAPVAAIA